MRSPDPVLPEVWTLVSGSTNLEDSRKRLRRIAEFPTLPGVGSLEVPFDRLPIVTAHGPGLAALAPGLARARQRIWLVAPFRSALRLQELGLVPDVIVLADRDVWPVDASRDAWADLPHADRLRLGAATLVVDAFAPADVIRSFPRACSFDSGLGAPHAALPFHGFGVLTSVALSLVAGHRTVATAGVEAGHRLGSLLSTLARKYDAGVVQLSPATMESFLRDAPRLAPALACEARPASESANPVSQARAVAMRELDRIAALRAELSQGLMWLAAARNGDYAASERLADLMARIDGTWQTLPEVRAAASRSQLTLLDSFWALSARAGGCRLDCSRSTQSTAMLVLADLERALDRHARDCRASVREALVERAEVVRT